MSSLQTDVVPGVYEEALRTPLRGEVLDDEAASWWTAARSLSGVQAVEGAGVAAVGVGSRTDTGAANAGEAQRRVRAIICAYEWTCAEALAVVYGPTPPNADALDGCESGESGGNPAAFNNGNYGLMQINAASHMDKLYAVTGAYDVDLLFDPEINVAVGWRVYVAAGETWQRLFSRVKRWHRSHSIRGRIIL